MVCALSGSSSVSEQGPGECVVVLSLFHRTTYQYGPSNGSSNGNSYTTPFVMGNTSRQG
jgi:hypothetical protein